MTLGKDEENKSAELVKLCVRTLYALQTNKEASISCFVLLETWSYYKA